MNNLERQPGSPWIVCIGGEDWWYHSHAHFDIQFMKRLSRRTSVLYICSIGMRMPSLRRDAQFWTRIRNKLRSVARSLRRVGASLWVYSPLPLPLYRSALGRGMNHALLGFQFRAVFSRLGIDRPLLWVNTPTGWPVVRSLGRSGLVYQRTDEYASYDFDNFNAEFVRDLDSELLSAADLVLHVDAELHENARDRAQRAILLDQGVDERFLADGGNAPPQDLPRSGGPIVGYVGTLETHKFDAALVAATARRLPDCCFVLIGPYHQNVEALRALPNVRLLGPRVHDDIVHYVRAFDICMLPTARTRWGLHCKPIKLMEYLAAGRPVVATNIPAVGTFRDCVHVENEPDGWVAAIREILRGNGKVSTTARARLARCTWDCQTDRVWSEIVEQGLVGRSRKTAGCDIGETK